MKNLLLLISVLGVPTASQAAGTINTIAFGGVINDGNAVLSSVTTAEGTYAVTSGAVTVTPSTANFGERFWRGTDPGNDAAAVTGLSLSNGLLNLGTTTSRYDFGATFTAATRFFILDAAQAGTTGGDPATIELTNAAGAVLGTYSYGLLGTSFGGALATINSSNRESGGNISLDYAGTWFSLADFTGTGDISGATGIRISNASGLDPVIVGVFAVPEPTSALLGALGLSALALRRKRSI